MAIFKFIDIPNYDKMLLTIKDHIINKTEVLSNPRPGGHDNSFANMIDSDQLLSDVPELRNWLFNHGLIVSYVVIFGINPMAKSLLHADSDMPNGNRDVRILLPIQNTEGSFTRFFNVPADQLLTTMNNDGIRYKTIIGNGPFTCLDEVELTKPIVLDTSVPHDIIVNKHSGYRLSMGIGFENPPYDWLND